VHEDSADAAQAARARIAAIQGFGVKPDWWKLPAFTVPGAWDAIEATVRHDNPLCRGVLVLGGGRSLDELKSALAVARQQPFIRGFAVGRTLFMAPARAWLAGETDDDTFAHELSQRYLELERAWLARREPA
jgi:5-dehydro-2-deoxygluconokinase